MLNIKSKTVLLPLLIALPTFGLQANNEDVSKEALQTELNQIRLRLATLEEQEKTDDKAGEQSQSLSNSINFYGSLRPTFGVTMSGSDDVWDVGDALSRIGIAADQELGYGLTGFAKGEFKVNIQANGDFGEARKAYVGIKGDFGRVAIGKQSSTQYRFIADPVDIFNRAATPLAYDSASPFRVNNLVTYRKDFGDVSFSVDSQFDGDNDSDFFNTGLVYNGDLLRAAVAYYSKESYDIDAFNGVKEQTGIGVSVAKSFGDLYLAASYQGTEVNSVDGSTLDLVGAYAITEIYKLKLGASSFDDGIDDMSSGNYNAYNTTLEWQGTADFRLFLEYQKTDFEHRDADDSIMVGMRYDFDYKF
ncbi:porin [Shewanella sp.]|uniref:porin n=1 Tax=Shewanella sp. TaxID=50422 RepID=UPI001ECB58DB|nr:porin [Shewanella sp.]NRB23403.1 porin [Shewanella sp.]